MKKLYCCFGFAFVHLTLVGQTIFDTSKNLFNSSIDTFSTYFEVPQVERLDKRDGLQTQILDIGNVKLYVQMEGKGIPMVLIHGGPGSTSHYFHPWFKEAAKFCKVIYYDQRGCGLSEYKRDTAYTIDQSVEDLENLRKTLRINKWIVLGHSYGGYLAQYYAIRHPESILGLILVASSVPMDIPVIADDRVFLSTIEQNKIDEIWSRPGKDYERKIYNAFLNGDWKRQHYYKPLPDHFAQIALYEGKSDTVYNSQIRKSQRTIDLTGYFLTSPLPTLIIEGRWDMLWLSTKARDLQAQHPNSQFLYFTHSAHSPFADEPQLFFSSIEKFIASLQGPSTGQITRWKRDIRKKESEHFAFLSGEQQFFKLLTADFGKAIAVFKQNSEKGIKTFSQSGITQIARQFRLTKDYEKAMLTYQLAIEAYPNSSDFFEYLADTLLLIGDKNQAKENYKKAFKLNPFELYLLDEIKKLE